MLIVVRLGCKNVWSTIVFQTKKNRLQRGAKQTAFMISKKEIIII